MNVYSNNIQICIFDNQIFYTSEMWNGFRQNNAPIIGNDYIQMNAVSYASTIEFTTLNNYILEFDIINSKSDRIGISIGENVETNYRDGYSFLRDVGNCLLEKASNEGTISISNNISSNFMSSGIHHILILRENNIASLYCDNTFIYDLDMTNNTNTFGSNIWGSGNIRFTNFNLHS